MPKQLDTLEERVISAVDALKYEEHFNIIVISDKGDDMAIVSFQKNEKVGDNVEVFVRRCDIGNASEAPKVLDEVKAELSGN